MKQIRHNTFETNSSSSHSITISNKGHFDSNALPVVKYYNGTRDCVVLTGEHFGWEERDYDDAQTKANYLATFVDTVELYQQDMSKLKKQLIDCIKEVTGCKSVVFDTEDGYIDHQSEEVALDAFENKDTLKHFIFNRGSVLRTDNDNH